MVSNHVMHPTSPTRPLRAYGDREGDGMVQISFVAAGCRRPRARARPPSASPRCTASASRSSPRWRQCAEGYSFFVVYGHSRARRRPSRRSTCPRCAPRRSRARRSSSASRRGSAARSSSSAPARERRAHRRHRRDPQLQGLRGDKGLESYKGFEAYNLGAQVENEQLAARARALRADAILVSQVITQRNCHKENGRALVDPRRQQGWRREVILLFGGPRIDHQLALELGFDAGFGPGTKPATSRRTSSSGSAAPPSERRARRDCNVRSASTPALIQGFGERSIVSKTSTPGRPMRSAATALTARHPQCSRNSTAPRTASRSRVERSPSTPACVVM